MTVEWLMVAPFTGVPHMFCWIKVSALRGPKQKSHIVGMHCLSRVSGNMTWGIVLCYSYVTIIHFIWHEDRGDNLVVIYLSF